MARTRRKHSYRRSRRWNPDAVVAAPAPAKTNPRHSRSRGRGRTRRNGWHMDREISSSRHAKRHRSRARKHFKGYSRRKAAHVVDYALGRMNPHGRKSRGRARTNPAQFPMPFFSAMTNPGRRSRTRRHARGGLRRNHPIKRKDARAMKRVLRSHHYSCR